MISIIVPVFNEAKNIKSFLSQFDRVSELEIIIVDGGSSDLTSEKIKELAILNNKIKLTTSNESGRANQMNHGAALAQGNILLFLHADTFLPNNYQQTIQNILRQPEVILGGFELAINGSEPALRLIETTVNWRSRFLSLPYGDQGLFITRDNFVILGGFAELPIMEDFNLVQRAKKQGKIAIARAKVTTSARRWQKLGIFKTTLVNQLIIIGYYFKISPTKLRDFYRSFNSKNG